MQFGLLSGEQLSMAIENISEHKTEHLPQDNASVLAQEIADFTVGNMNILNEGEAMSELEVYAAIFDQGVELLGQRSLDDQQLRAVIQTII